MNGAHLALQEFKGKLVLDFLGQKVTWDSRADRVLLVLQEWVNTALLDLKDLKVFKEKKDHMAKGFPDQRGIEGSQDRGGRGDSRAQASKEKGVIWGHQVLQGQLD